MMDDEQARGTGRAGTRAAGDGKRGLIGLVDRGEGGKLMR